MAREQIPFLLECPFRHLGRLKPSTPHQRCHQSISFSHSTARAGTQTYNEPPARISALEWSDNDGELNLRRRRERMFAGFREKTFSTCIAVLRQIREGIISVRIDRTTEIMASLD